MWMFPRIGVPQNGWFIMEHPIKMDDLGYHYFWKHPSGFNMFQPISRWWQLKKQNMFTPTDPWGNGIQFHLRIFFSDGLVQPRTSFM